MLHQPGQRDGRARTTSRSSFLVRPSPPVNLVNSTSWPGQWYYECRLSQKYSDKSQVPKPTLSAVTHAFTVTGTTPCHTTRTGICKRIVNLIANAFRRRQPNKPAYISDIYMPLLSATMFSIIRKLPHLKAHKYYLSPCTQLLPSVTACQCPAPGLDRRVRCSAGWPTSLLQQSYRRPRPRPPLLKSQGPR